MIEILNRQRKVKLPKGMREFAELAATVVDEASGKRISVVFVSDSAMKRLNLKFREKDVTTDVLSFSFEEEPFDDEMPHLGDVVISAEQAARQARENGQDLVIELKQLILHGFLHLAGYDHETDDGEMDRLELKLRRKLMIAG